MPGVYAEDLKRRVREANNLAEIVETAVGKLVRAGRNLKACCPFHNEKTPSFNVNVEGQYFKCFGCGKSGDVFTFVMLHERVEFPEAFKILADRAGIRVELDPQAAVQHKKETEWKTYLYKLNEAAGRFYREQLFSDAGKAAREYIKKRGISEKSCEQFALGYAPSGGSPLLARLQSQKAPVKAILLAGLGSQREDGSVRDFFYDRLMFPIFDIQGRIIAFGGRVLGDGEPKYLNTRDTPLFSKNRTVYGLNDAREQIVATREAILVEGYTDVMMCHQFGVTNVVACLGTAITVEHVRQLRRMADKLVMLTDSDAAGAKASERSLAVLFAEEMPARVARLPGADKDPCDFLLAKGKEPFVQALGEALDLFEYKFDMVRRKQDLTTPMGLKNTAEELMALISLIPDPLLKNRYRYEVLRRLNINERDLKYEVRAAPAQTAREDPAPDLGGVPAPEHRLAKAERELLRFLFHEPAWLEQAVTAVDLAALTGAPEQVIGRAMLAALAEGKLPPDASLLQDADAASIIAREVLPRLNDSGEGGILKQAETAQSLCIALADEGQRGIKLDAAARLEILIKDVETERLRTAYGEAMRKLTAARLQGDKDSEEKTYMHMVQIRKK